MSRDDFINNKSLQRAYLGIRDVCPSINDQQSAQDGYGATLNNFWFDFMDGEKELHTLVEEGKAPDPNRISFPQQLIIYGSTNFRRSEL